MIQWTITTNWLSPKEGEIWRPARDERAAAIEIQKWIREHMPEFGDRPFWRYIKDRPGITVIDFGSHTTFGLIEEREKGKT